MPTLISPSTTNVYRLRSQTRLSQSEFGALFSISKGHVSKLENGRTRPSMDLLDRIAQRFKVDPRWVVKPIDRRARL